MNAGDMLEKGELLRVLGLSQDDLARRAHASDDDCALCAVSRRVAAVQARLVAAINSRRAE